MDNNQTRSMEAVHTFTNELFSLYDFKVPISKAKMGAITKSALKAIKFYKHVVQNVEKFILKCKPEYKIPGLYVIDAIVRQSRHQFGTEKDVFAPRFARNMEDTFAHLFRCSQEDKSKIIRVLNLWQKNNVFAPEVIQPLFDLANPDHPVHLNFNLQQQQNQSQNDVLNGGVVRESPIKEDQNSEMLNASNLQKFQYQQLMMQQQADSGTSGVTLESMKFNKQLLEFDYGSDGDEDKTDAMQYPAASSNALPYQFSKVLEDPNIIRQLQNIKNIDVQRYLNEMPSGANAMEMNSAPMLGSGISLANINSLRGPQTINLIESKDQDVEFIGGDMSEVIPVSSRSPTPPKHNSSKRRRSRSYSRDRYRGRRRSRSRSHSRSRSRSPRNRRRNSRDRPRDKEREKQREIEKERRRKGLPDIKKEHLSVCSTTLWVGHLSKLVQQEELSDTFGKYGDIISIDMIPPRGCAYIVMNRRQDAHKAMQQLKNHKMHNRTITISWAAGKGVKGKEWKDYFDQTLGVTYIPYGKLTQLTDFESLEEGGMYDEDTMPAWIKDKMKQPVQPTNNDGLMMPSFFGLPSDVSAIDTSQPPPSAQTTLMPTAMPTFPLGARLLMPNVLPLGVPPPNMLGMVFPGADKSTVIPPGLMGFPLAAAAAAAAVNAHHQNAGDDHMDIEMEDEHHNAPSTSKDALAANALLQQQAAFFNQPPPQLGMNALLMQNEPQNDRGRNNRSQSREKDRDFRRRRSDNNSFGSRSSGRWSNNDSNSRDNRGGRSDNGRSRDDFNSNRDDYDRRQGGRDFSSRGGFNQQTRGGRGNFSSRGGSFGTRGRDGYNNNFNDRPGFHERDSRGARGGRNWNRDENDDRRQGFRSGNRNPRWSDNQREDDGWNDDENSQNNQNESNNEVSEENPNNFEINDSRGNEESEQNQQEDAPPGTDDYDQQPENVSKNASEAFNSAGDFNEDNSNTGESAVVESAGNTTPLCDENEAKE